MEKATVNGKNGYALIVAIIAINLIAIFSLMAASVWETEIARNNEQELIFRANRYVRAIKKFRIKYPNNFLKDLKLLEKEKFIRKLYSDPVSDTGEWNYVFRNRRASNKTLLIVPFKLLKKYLKTFNLIGVASSSVDESYMIYRGKNRYEEWAFYYGQNINKDMPELKFINN